MSKFNKQEGEHELNMIKLSYSFALKMALVICWSVVSSVIILGIFFGAVTPISFFILILFAGILGLISFSVTRSACL